MFCFHEPSECPVFPKHVTFEDRNSIVRHQDIVVPRRPCFSAMHVSGIAILSDQVKEVDITSILSINNLNDSAQAAMIISESYK